MQVASRLVARFRISRLASMPHLKPPVDISGFGASSFMSKKGHHALFHAFASLFETSFTGVYITKLLILAIETRGI